MAKRPLLPNTSILEVSMKILSESLEEVPKVGAIVIAGKSLLKSTIPLFSRLNENVAAAGS